MEDTLVCIAKQFIIIGKHKWPTVEFGVNVLRQKVSKAYRCEVNTIQYTAYTVHTAGVKETECLVTTFLCKVIVPWVENCQNTHERM